MVLLITFFQVWSFSPPPENNDDDTAAVESASSTPGLGSSSADDSAELVLNPGRHRTVFSDPPPTIPSGNDGDDQPMPDAPSS